MKTDSISATPVPRADGDAAAGASLPLVSVVVPVWNGARYLRESLDSILAQTYPNVEVLVLDDASTDETPAVVASYGERIRSFRQPQNRGQFANVNAGIAMARGDLIAVYHADDVYDPAIVEREVSYLRRHPEAGAVFCMDVFVDAAGREYGRLALPPEVRGGGPFGYALILNALLTYKNRFLRGPSAMVRAEVYRDVGLYRGEEFHIAADLEMWLRIARRYPVGILEEYLLRYRHFHGNSTQRYYHLRDEPEGHFRMLDAHLADGGRALVTSAALAAHEAHRAEDALMLAVNSYIAGRLDGARMWLRAVRLRHLLGSPRVQRARLLSLYLILQALARLPRSAAVADAFYRRWHVKGAPA